MAKALDDITVLDFSRAMAGPTCTRLLAELGAEIIKIEMPGTGDFTRDRVPLTKGGESSYWIMMNRGKKSVTLNLQSEAGRHIAQELAKKVDVLVENFSPGVMDRLGLSYKELAKLNSGLIYASISGFGHSGPRAAEPSFDMIAQALGGVMSINGFPDSPPLRVGPSIGDFMGGLFAMNSILTALHYKSKTGEGQWIDLSLQDGMWLLTAMEYASTYWVEDKIPQRLGSGAILVTPFNVYQAKDGYVTIATANNQQWERLVGVMGREDLMGERYAQMGSRVKDRDKIDAMVGEWVATKNVTEALKELKDARIPCSPVPSFDQVANDPQLLFREMITEVEQPLSGKVKVPGSVFKLSKTPGDPRLPASPLGEHNYEILCGMLGYNEQAVKKFSEEGII